MYHMHLCHGVPVMCKNRWVHAQPHGIQVRPMGGNQNPCQNHVGLQGFHTLTWVDRFGRYEASSRSLGLVLQKFIPKLFTDEVVFEERLDGSFGCIEANFIGRQKLPFASIIPEGSL